jgi:xylan 1,4-beta-xylosidase
MQFRLVLLLIMITSGSFAQQLVMRGDHPDPSVVKIGNKYWATATTSNWFPAYPLLSSTDLVNWKQQGYVFNTMPEWADYYFWAPEISYDNGKVYVYYSAHKKGGNLCVAVASADRPEGPYKDHGPLVCQVDGSIDAFPMRDENGKLFLIWKEDGNSIKQPTPIFAQQINEERTAMIGEKVELFRNTLPWEANLVEGVSMMKHNGYYYAFYAAAGCCGVGCTYKTGIARSKKLLGPWEKFEKNPLLPDDTAWRCKGHGTPVEKDGKYYYVYHAYRQDQGVYTGREGLIQPFHFTADDWIEFDSITVQTKTSDLGFEDDFTSPVLKQEWQWSVAKMPEYSVRGGSLFLKSYPSLGGTFMGLKTLSKNFSAIVDINPQLTTGGTGISVIGDDENAVSLIAENDSIFVSIVKDSTEQKLFARKAPANGDIKLGVRVLNGNQLVFYYDTGSSRIQVNGAPLDASDLPPWDRALRIGFTSRGNGQAVIDKFTATFMGK